MKLTHPPQQGFTLVEGIVALSVLMGLLVLGNHYTRQRLEESLQQQAAAHLRLVTAAAVRYAQDRYDQLGSSAERDEWQASQQKPEVVQVSLEVWRYQDLIAKKYLLELYQRSKWNLYGQGYALYILEVEKPKPRKQLLVLTTGGKKLPERDLRQIARQAGGQGGYISQEDKTQVTGSQQGWQLQLPAETGYQPPPDGEPQYEQPGHLACLHTLYPDDLLHTSQLLHRTAQREQPKLNQMETDLMMQQHQIVFKKESTGVTGSLSAQGLAFQKDHQQRIDFGYDAYTERAALRLKDATGSIEIDAKRVTTTGKPTVGKAVLKGYSAPELHAYWNKVPYYELSVQTNQDQAMAVGQQLADWLCLKKENSRPDEAALGRLFMIGAQSSQTTGLYLCGHTATPNSAAYLLSQFPPKADPAAQHKPTRSTLSLPQHSARLSSLSPNQRGP